MNRDEFVETLKGQIDQWNADIAKLEACMKDASGDMERQYADAIAETSRYRAEAQARLAEGLKASSDNWDRARGDMEAAWKDISDGFRKAWGRFG